MTIISAAAQYERLRRENEQLRIERERIRRAWDSFIGKTRRGQNGCWLIPVDEMTDLAKAFVSEDE